jgi:DNA polymerase-3 subunit beta
VSIAASREEVTPVLTAVMVSSKAKELSLVATDRFRVAIKTVPWNSKSPETEVLIPARVLSEIAKTFSGSGDIEIGIGSSEKEMVGFTSGNKMVATSTIKGKYPAVLQLFPSDTPHFAVLNTADLSMRPSALAWLLIGISRSGLVSAAQN